MKTIFTEVSTVNEIASLEADIAKKTARLKVLKSHLKVNYGNACDVLGTEHEAYMCRYVKMTNIIMLKE